MSAKHQISKKLGYDRYTVFNDCVQALVDAGFEIQYADIDSGAIGVNTGFSWRSFGEHITLRIDWDGVAHIKSICNHFQLVDWGKNKNNIELFLTNFNAPVGQDEYV